MNWVLILAIAVPVLFVIGMINNAIKDQKKLEDGALKKYLSKRKVKNPNGYDDDDDWGVKARALKRAVADDTATNKPSPVTSSEALAKESSASSSYSTELFGDVDSLKPHAPRSSEASFKPMGDTDATNAASYFSAYYKQDEQGSDTAADANDKNSKSSSKQDKQ